MRLPTRSSATLSLEGISSRPERAPTPTPWSEVRATTPFRATAAPHSTVEPGSTPSMSRRRTGPPRPRVTRSSKREPTGLWSSRATAPTISGNSATRRRESPRSVPMDPVPLSHSSATTMPTATSSSAPTWRGGEIPSWPETDPTAQPSSPPPRATTRLLATPESTPSSLAREMISSPWPPRRP